MYLKLLLILAVLIFIYINVRPHLSMILFVIELIRTFFVNSITLTKKVSETVVDETSIGAKLVVNKITNPMPEESRPSKGYCYVGEWKGVRSCVKVNNSPCSTQVYSTMQQCVNPQLR